MNGCKWLKCRFWDGERCTDPIQYNTCSIPTFFFKHKIYDALYLFGIILIQYGTIMQIIKTFTTHRAEDLSLIFVASLVIGEACHLPRSLSSSFWVWKLNTIVCLILCLMLLSVTIAYGSR